MRNFLRKATGTLLFAGACAGALFAGSALRDLWDDRETRAQVEALTPASEVVSALKFGGKPLELADPTPCAAQALQDAKSFLRPSSEIIWVWGDFQAQGAWGLTWSDAKVIALDVSAPCDRIFPIAAHEMSHATVDSELGVERGVQREEIVSDCVSSLLTMRYAVGRSGVGTHTPYLWQVGGCTPANLTSAQKVISDMNL